MGAAMAVAERKYPAVDKSATRLREKECAKALDRAARREPQDWQERIEPTEADTVTISNGTRRVKEQRRRRKPDARVWGEMTAEQELAADRIVHGFLLTGGNIGVPIVQYGARLDRSQPTDPASLREFEGRVARCYQEWVRECRRQGVPFADVLDYLTKGVTMAEIDARCGQRKGTAREQFFVALDLHAKVSPAYFRDAQRKASASALAERAREFAARAHAKQVRKYTGEPYVTHCIEVAEMVAATGAREEVVAAAYLHDTVEDCEVTPAMLRVAFGEEVARLVLEVTDVSRPADGKRSVRKALDREHVAKASPGGQTIKLADLISNARSIVASDPKFAVVYLAEKETLLGVLTRGDGRLMAQARSVLEEGRRALQVHSTRENVS